jgi:hypothetical protein
LVKFLGGKVHGFPNVARNGDLTAVEESCTDRDGDGYCESADCEDFLAAIHHGAAELCDGLDNDCDGQIDESPACATVAGSVPDGVAQSGAPLVIGKLPDDEILLLWSASCSAEDTDYEVYEGSLGDFASHTPVYCSTGGSTSKSLTPAGVSSYYIVVSRTGISEGSYGLRGGDAERPVSLSACLPQSVAVCP